ncbi:MAG: HAD family hydrolase [Acidiferrobacteraceae bacterium]|nr:HAD family hydrolase [Acidiferrobacteraceae bacterium]|tara:strand:+ start:6086 stop:6742 length:657 start_codon:yes stop_codon:yes gene_type:complete
MTSNLKLAKDYFIFDLDGTISDPRIGMIRSINYSLDRYQFEQAREKDISALIGLPLDEIYLKLCGEIEASMLELLIAAYRESYHIFGYRENSLYEGIESSLNHLAQTAGGGLGICTSKPSAIAKKILKMFGLRNLFEFISGGDVGVEKSTQIAELLKKKAISHNSIMIGDRFIDIRAAKANEIRSVGVLWGYGSRLELEQESPNQLLSAPDEIKNLEI